MTEMIHLLTDLQIHCWLNGKLSVTISIWTSMTIKHSCIWPGRKAASHLQWLEVHPWIHCCQ